MFYTDVAGLKSNTAKKKYAPSGICHSTESPCLQNGVKYKTGKKNLEFIQHLHPRF